MIVRLSLALLVGIPAAMAYPWQSVSDRWLLGVAIGVIVVVFAWWRGHFVTTMLARRFAMGRRRGQCAGAVHRSQHSSEFATVALEVTAGGQRDLPVDLVTGHLDRYGVRFDKVRITSRDRDGVRTTWVGLTLGAADNIAALSARSPRIPLQDTVELAARRLSDHLREMGWEVHPCAGAVEAVAAGQATETWRGIADEHGHLACYRVAVDDTLAQTLQSVWAFESGETWTTLEFTGSRAQPELAAVCALRTTERPAAKAPLAGLTAENGLHSVVLAALSPTSDHRLPGRPVPVTPQIRAQVHWPAATAPLSRT